MSTRFRSPEEALKYWQAFKYYLDKMSERMQSPEDWRAKIWEEAWDPKLTLEEIKRKIDELVNRYLGSTPEEMMEKGVPIMNEWDRLVEENTILRNMIDNLTQQMDVVPRRVYEEALEKLRKTQEKLERLSKQLSKWRSEAKHLREERERLEREIKMLRAGVPKDVFEEVKRRLDELTSRVEERLERLEKSVEEKPIRPPMIGVSKEETWYHVRKIPAEYLVVTAADGRPRLLVECDLVSFPENDPQVDRYLSEGWIEPSTISERERDDLVRYALELLARNGVRYPRAYRQRILDAIDYTLPPEEIKRRVEREVDRILEIERATGMLAPPTAPPMPPTLQRIYAPPMTHVVLVDRGFVRWLEEHGISVEDFLAMDPLTQRELYYRDYRRSKKVS